MYKEACEKIYKYHERTVYYVARNDIHDLTWVLFKIYIYIYIYVCVCIMWILKVYLRKQSFSNNGRRTKIKRLRERERERGSGESYERVNEMNSNYFHTDTSLREYIYTQSQR